MLNPKTFRCKRCGECCIKYIVKLSEADIKPIKKLGYGEFTEFDDNLSGLVLKKDDNYKCVFLEKDKEKGFSCKIYEHRPSVCMKYPFLSEKVESCKPVTFSSKV